MTTQPFQLFAKERGPANNYRIPSIITTKHGTVVACADARYFTAGDNPNRIDKVVCRSLDNGKTWQDMILAVQECGKSKRYSSAAIDPCLAYDDDTDTIFMLYSHTPAGIGILNSKRGTGYDKKGRLIVFYGKEKFFMAEDGVLYDKNDKPTDYKVDTDSFDVFENGNRVGNIKTYEGGFREYPTSFMYITKSTDDGLTWSKPVCISTQVKEEYMSFYGCGPGIGIKIKKGQFKNRIIVPIYYTPRMLPLMECASCIYSDDNGNSWKMGGVMGENRKRLGLFNVGRKLIFDWERTSEAQIVELPDGTLKAFIRNHSPRKKIAVATSSDGGVTWNDFHYIDLPQCICQLSAIAVKDNGKDAILLLNAASTTKRENGVIRLSYDNGVTFPYSKLIKEGQFVYSSMCQMSDGNIGILFEGSTSHDTVDFISLSIDDIKK